MIASVLLYGVAIYFAAFYLAIYFNTAYAVLKMSNHYG
jgi:hypothetical protein